MESLRPNCIAQAVLVASAMTFSLSTLSPAHAGAPPRVSPRAVTVNFRLHVSGDPGLHTTFWVAYGPLAGTWGLIRLQPRGDGDYWAARRLPSTGRTVFSYLAGQRVAVTRVGQAPGNPVTTIGSIGPVPAGRLSRMIVQWSSPRG